MTESERKELEELRLFKQAHEGKALNRAFSRLQQLIDISSHDPSINIRAFRAITECLICLREEIQK
jgi:hypothetical protein